MKRTAAVTLLLVLLAGWAAAQGPGFAPKPPGPPMPPHPPGMGKWWKNSEIAKELQLSDQQVKQIEQTFFDYRLKLIDLRADVERNEAKLQPLIEADRPDEQQVSAQIDATLAARAKLEKTSTLMMLAIRRVLSVEQWKKLQEIQQKREGPFHMRFDGPMGERGQRFLHRREPFPGHEVEEDVIIERAYPGSKAAPAPPPKPGLD